MKILAINGRRFSSERLSEALAMSENGKSKLEFLVENGDYISTYPLAYAGGAKNPHLVRDEAIPDLIAEIFKARTGK